MATIKYKPTTPARRNMTVPAYGQIITKDTPEKSLVVIKKKHAGRNSYGRITVRHRGGGNKIKYPTVPPTSLCCRTRQAPRATSSHRRV